LNNIYNHISSFFTASTKCIFISNSNKSEYSQIVVDINLDQISQQIKQFTPFVENLNKSDRLHQDYLRSHTHDKHNTEGDINSISI